MTNLKDESFTILAMIFSNRYNFVQLKIDTVHDHIIEKECLEYLRGTLWDFLDIVIFSANLFVKMNKKTKKYTKIA